MDKLKSKYLLDLQDSLKNKTPSALSGAIESTPEIYERVKYEYISLGKLSKNTLSAQLCVYLLLIATDKRDMDFCHILLNDRDFESINTESSKIALGRYYKIEGRLFDTVRLLYPIFENNKLNAIDLEVLLDAAQRTAQFDKCDKVIQYSLSKYSNEIGWKIIAFKYQVGISHIYPKNKEFIENNLRYLYPRCAASEEFFYLGLAAYQGGFPDVGIKCLEDSFFAKPIQTELKDEEIHGFSPGTALASMVKLIDVISAMEIKAFPVFGSLLGLYRDGKFMDYDKDADIGVLIDDVFDITEFIRRICEQGRYAAPCMITHSADSHKWNVALVDVDSNVSIDIFFFHKTSSLGYSAGIHTAGGVLRWMFEDISLQKKTIADLEFWVPDDIEAHLIEIYGSGWNQPVEVWDSLLNCPNLSSDSIMPISFYALQRLYKALRQKKIMKVDNYLNVLQSKWTGVISEEFLSKVRVLRNELNNKESIVYA